MDTKTSLRELNCTRDDLNNLDEYIEKVDYNIWRLQRNIYNETNREYATKEIGRLMTNITTEITNIRNHIDAVEKEIKLNN